MYYRSHSLTCASVHTHTGNLVLYAQSTTTHTHSLALDHVLKHLVCACNLRRSLGGNKVWIGLYIYGSNKHHLWVETPTDRDKLRSERDRPFVTFDTLVPCSAILLLFTSRSSTVAETLHYIRCGFYKRRVVLCIHWATFGWAHSLHMWSLDARHYRVILIFAG